MQTTSGANSLQALGIDTASPLYKNLHAPELYEHTIRAGTGRLASGGAMVVDTTPYTGRSPKDKFIVRTPEVDDVAWGKVNVEFDAVAFDSLYDRVCEHLGRQPALQQQDLFGGADKTLRLPIRLITESAWHALFARNMLIRPTAEELETHKAEYTIVHAPTFEAQPERDGTRSDSQPDQR